MIASEWLQAFALFAEDANLSRAARRLHLSQPAVHAQLKRLAEALGVPLYRRAGRGLALTDEGRVVAAFARDEQERRDALVARLRGERCEGRVVLSAGAGALRHVLTAGLRAFMRSYAGRLDVVTADGPGAIEAVVRGSAHVGVAALSSAPSELVVQRITQVPQVLALPRAHRLARKRSVSIADLGRERLILPPAGRPQRAVLDAAFATHEIAPLEAALAVGWDLVVHLVALGVGVAVVNGSVRLPRGLVSRPVRDLPAVRYLAFTRRGPPEDARRLAACLAEHGEAWRGGATGAGALKG